MDIETALEIVISLASENVLTDREVSNDPEILKPEQDKQNEAIEIINKFVLEQM